MSAITNPVELRRRGIEVLVRELGYANAMRFLLQYNTGQGDYTKERKELLPDWKVEEMMHESNKFLKRSEPGQ